ncbi:siderophore-interacting protein [Demequina sp.]|uniref:siderophore-interacting protein n=1 Tax=Demequina sp. TaxID=2050685 RepID=UPI0025E5CF07|nr:siderophore-interacting protein [Demequina sp.]
METVHAATVASIERMSPRMVRLSLALDQPAAWTSTGCPDEFVHVEVAADAVEPDGRASRHYTVSGLTVGGFRLEAFLHGDGPGAAWARDARVGDRVRVSAPKAYYRVPDDARARILCGDATALPAIARILAEAGAGERFRVIVELPDLQDVRALPSAADVSVEWRVGGNGHGASVLRDALVEVAVAELQPGARSYVWVACESVHSRRIRQLLRREFALPVSHYRIVGYWHADLERAMRVWENATDEQKARYASLWRQDRSDEENWLELEPFLQSLGV